MADLNNFTVDEQLILIHLVQSAMLKDILVEFTGEDMQTIQSNTAIASGKQIAKMSLAYAKSLIERARLENIEGAKQAKLDHEANNN